LAPAAAALAPGSAHVVVFLHGLGGTVHDTRLLRAHLKLRCGPQLVCVAAASVQGAETEISIAETGARIAAEVCAALTRLAEDGLQLQRLSFVAFSLGGVIARAALRHPLLRPLVAKHAHAFVSLAAPHLGVAYAALLGAGLALRVRVRPSAALSELALADGGAAGADGALLVALARGRGREESSAGGVGSAVRDSTAAALIASGNETSGEVFSCFRHVILVASAQDGFSPRDSCLAQIPVAALNDVALGHTCERSGDMRAQTRRFAPC
jgi:pimeloyl-ACP methyl ester carboxylesterase